MKFDSVTQRVEVLPEYSLGSSSVMNSSGKPGVGRLEPEETRVQALYVT